MTRRSLLLLAVLVYVTLDLSFPAMPGAFVFEPEDSAESTQVRARSAAATISPPAPAVGLGLVALLAPTAIRWHLPRVDSAERRARPFAGRTSHAPLDPAPTSEDPH